MPLLSFTGVTVKVPAVTGLKSHLPAFMNSNVPKKEILHNVSGTFPKKGLVAVMGPSGSSKTTLLNTISNRMAMAGSTGMDAYGEVRVNGSIVPPDFFFSKKVSFVPQETCLFAELTPRESIRFATLFTYPHWNDEQIEEQVDNIITALNIQKCADSMIGNEIFRGISGGEAKRVSIGVNIVNQPEILILDEPTTGLDSETATIVVRSILNLATPSIGNGDEDDGRLIIMTLHQPSSEVYEMIDHIVLLAEGHIVYNGPTKEAIPYFASLGFRLPANTNPADFLLDVVQMAEELDDEPQKRQRPGRNGGKRNKSSAGIAGEEGIQQRGPAAAAGRGGMSSAQIDTINGREVIVKAPKHANKFERARYLAHAWQTYEETMKTEFGGAGGGAAAVYASSSRFSSVQADDLASKRDRLHAMMVKYQKQHGSKYSVADPNSAQYEYDEVEGQDTYNYDDTSNPLRYSTSAGGGGGGGNSQYSSAVGGFDDLDGGGGGTSNDGGGGGADPFNHGMSTMQVFLKQLITLTTRSWTCFIRQKLNIPMKLVQTMISAILMIALYYRFSHDQQSVLQRTSCMYLLIIVQIFATVLGVALTFPSERGVYVLEQASRMYMVAPYYVSKLIIDLPILTIGICIFSILTYFPIGFYPDFFRFVLYTVVLESIALIGHGLGLVVSCLVPSPSMAVLLAPCTIAPFILFSHIAIPSGYVIPILRPLQYLSPFWWGLDALVINEFRGMKLGCLDPELIAVPSVSQGLLFLCRMETEKDVFANYSIDPMMFWPSIIVLYTIAGTLIVSAGAALMILSARISKATKLLPPTRR